MGKGRTFNKKPVTRPRKSGLERRRREVTQKKFLVGLGMDEEVVRKMESKTIRSLVQKPAKAAALVKA